MKIIVQIRAKDISDESLLALKAGISDVIKQISQAKVENVTVILED